MYKYVDIHSMISGLIFNCSNVLISVYPCFRFSSSLFMGRVQRTQSVRKQARALAAAKYRIENRAKVNSHATEYRAAAKAKRADNSTELRRAKAADAERAKRYRANKKIKAGQVTVPPSSSATPPPPPPPVEALVTARPGPSSELSSSRGRRTTVATTSATSLFSEDDEDMPVAVVPSVSR